MRIGIDARPLGAGSGGIWRYTEELIHALARVDDRNHYLLYAREPGRDATPLGENVAWHAGRVRAKAWVELAQLLGRVGEVDLFHGTNYTAPLLGRFPTVLTVHDLTVHLFPGSHPRLRRLRHRLLPTLCRRAERIIADSYRTKSDLVRHYRLPEDKIDVVYLAAAARFRPVRCAERLERVRARYGLPEAFVLYLGTLEPRKNLPVLVRAMARILRDGSEHRLVIAGEGSALYVRHLRELAEREGLEPGRDVRFAGHVRDEDLPALYSVCDVFVYPSRYEGFGLPPLEAMACGAPVIVPNHSSFFEIYRDAGLTLELGCVDTLEAALRRLLWDPALHGELVERGLKLAQSRTWEDTALETLAVYRRAVA